MCVCYVCVVQPYSNGRFTYANRNLNVCIISRFLLGSHVFRRHVVCVCVCRNATRRRESTVSSEHNVPVKLPLAVVSPWVSDLDQLQRCFLTTGACDITTLVWPARDPVLSLPICEEFSKSLCADGRVWPTGQAQLHEAVLCYHL